MVIVPIVLFACLCASPEQLPLTDLLNLVGTRSQAASAGEFEATFSTFAFPGTPADPNHDAAYEAFQQALSAIRNRDSSASSSDEAVFVSDRFVKERWLPLIQRSVSMVYDKDSFRLSQNVARDSLIYTIRRSRDEANKWTLKELSADERTHIKGDYLPTDIANDGTRQYSVSNSTLRVATPGGLTDHYRLAALDPSFLRWDQIPHENLVRADQELIYERLDDDLYLYGLRNRHTGNMVEQVFSAKHASLVRASYKHEAKVVREMQWLGFTPATASVFLPKIYAEFSVKPDGPCTVEVRYFRDWVLRPINREELSIPQDRYTRVSDESAGAEEDAKTGEPGLLTPSVSPDRGDIDAADLSGEASSSDAHN